MKISRFAKMLRGQETCFQRQYRENIAEDSDASLIEKDNLKHHHQREERMFNKMKRSYLKRRIMEHNFLKHQRKERMFHKMKHSYFKRRIMEHNFLKHHRFGHGRFENSNDSGIKHGFNNDIRMRHGHHMHHGIEHDHHRMEHDHHMHHGMEHGHHMHHGIQHGHHMRKRMKCGHMKFHKMARLFRHQKRGCKPSHEMHHKMKSDCCIMEQGDPDERHEKGEIRQMHPGKASKDLENVDKSPEGGKMATASEIRTYPSKTDAQVTTEDNRFQICMNTSSYQPEEICVKIVKGKIEISAIHESVDDDLYEFHEMYRSFTIPENVDPAKVSSRLESDGKLIVEAPINSIEESSNERDIPVINIIEE